MKSFNPLIGNEIITERKKWKHQKPRIRGESLQIKKASVFASAIIAMTFQSPKSAGALQIQSRFQIGNFIKSLNPLIGDNRAEKSAQTQTMQEVATYGFQSPVSGAEFGGANLIKETSYENDNNDMDRL